VLGARTRERAAECALSGGNSPAVPASCASSASSSRVLDVKAMDPSSGWGRCSGSPQGSGAAPGRTVIMRVGRRQERPSKPVRPSSARAYVFDNRRHFHQRAAASHGRTMKGEHGEVLAWCRRADARLWRHGRRGANVVGAIGLVEKHARRQRAGARGDIVTSMSGQRPSRSSYRTAEGRLVLGGRALVWWRRSFKPKIHGRSCKRLTGAIMVALRHRTCRPVLQQ